MLVSYDTAADHLRLGDLTSDPEVQASVTRYLAQAEGLVLQHVTLPEDPPWTEATDPATDWDFAIVQAAILQTLASLWRDRGDAAGTGDERRDGPMHARVTQLLSQLKFPSFA
jgi:hypothetical protein